MSMTSFDAVELAEAWVEGEEGARRRSGSGLGPSDGTRESACSLLEVAPGALRNPGDAVLRFVAVYAIPDVVTRYEAPVQPDGERERRPAS